MRLKWLFLLVACLGLSLLATACFSRPLLYDVDVYPATISPNADGQDDVTLIRYKLGRNANVSIYLVDAGGERHYFRRNLPRSRATGTGYSVYFGGVIDRSEGDLIRARMLPSGEYTLVIEATDDQGRTEQVSKPLTLVDADTTYPQILGFSVDHHEFTPNRDGVNDRVKINYDLTKEATVLVYLIGEDGIKYPIAEDEGPNSIVEPGAVGTHRYDYEGGVDLGAQPPPDGTYTLVALAEDKVGNKEMVTDTLTIKDGGVPWARIVGLEWEASDTIIPLGGTLWFTATVENYGKTPIRTTGPPAGTVYTSDQNFNSLGWYQSSGAWRFGIDWASNPAYPYPFRWALGRPDELRTEVVDGETFYYLDPGKRVQITGGITILDPLPRNPDEFYAGLIHEDVWVVNDHVDTHWITVDVTPSGPWNQK
ncbi:MAG: hypothetical protein NUW24_16930 [Anaerolineae bacterium]|nr:hypothetical protein [Anaerolineae bacterium]MDH7475317.1 hypothetical protein [Anaerolineae bacterium]